MLAIVSAGPVRAEGAAAAPSEPDEPAADSSAPPATPPLGWRIGSLTLLPRVGLSEAYNDNIDYAETQRQGSRVQTWSPSLGLSLPQGDDRYEWALRGELTRYASVPANNVHNAEAVMDAVNLTGDHSAVAWRLAWQDAHEEVGNSPLSELSSTPNRFQARAVGAVWRVDSDDGVQRGEFEATMSRKTYLNHRETARVGDVTTRAAVARYLCTVAPATRLLAELRDVGARYSARETALDNADQRWLLGVQREAGDDPSRELTGSLKFGLQTKQPFAVAVDCHSGFGMNDRLWFPYAHTARPIDHLAELHALAELMDQALLHHRYVVEPQSRQYLAHGDLWDHLYLRGRAARPAQAFLPLTLEMGSWLWIKKNPRQVFSRHGIFNPLIEHRQRRVLRRHLGLLDFIGRAAGSHARWRPDGALREHHHQQALARWYGRRP